MSVAEMRMLRWMSGNTQKYRTKMNAFVSHNKLVVAPNMRKIDLDGLYMYMKVRKCNSKRDDCSYWKFGTMRMRGRPKSTWIVAIKMYLKVL